MKRTIPTNLWRSGGILERVVWEAGEAKAYCWDGERRPIQDGDTVTFFCTGAPVVTIVDVERAS